MERYEEATLEGKLSSLVGQKNSHIIRDKSNWALLASLAHDKYVIVEGLGYTCRGVAEEEGLHLVGVGSTTRPDDRMAFYRSAEYLVSLVDKMMREKQSPYASHGKSIALGAAACGLQIYEQVGREYRLILPPATRQPFINLSTSFGQMRDALKLTPRFLLGWFTPLWIHYYPTPNGTTGRLSTSRLPLEESWAALQRASSHWLTDTTPANLTLTGHHHQVTNNGHSLSRGTNNVVRTTADYDLPLVPTCVGVGAAPGQNTWGIVPGRMSGIVPEASDYVVYSNFSSHNYGTGAGGHSLRSPGGRLTVDLSELDLEVGGQQLSITRNDGARRTDSGETWDVAKKLEGVMGQGFFVCLPLCLTAYSQLKDAPDYVQFITFGGLAFITAGFAIGMLCKSVARRRLAIRLVSSTAITVLAFSIASQLSGATYKALTALVATALNFIIMLLPF